MGSSITIATLDGTARFPAYVAHPEGTPKAAVIVAQEIFGINAGIREKADHLASLGYLAIAPDLFWRIEPGVELDPDVPEQLERAFALYKAFDVDAAILDIEATIRHARTTVPRVGIVGYCLGGLLAYLAATRTDVDASVGYYGGGIDARIDEAYAIAQPVLLHFGDRDDHIDAVARTRIADGVAGSGKVEIMVHADAGHGFAATGGSRRVPAAAERADARTEAFLWDHLAG